MSTFLFSGCTKAQLVSPHPCHGCEGPLAGILVSTGPWNYVAAIRHAQRIEREWGERLVIPG
jgi:hypothetical protein